LFFSSVALAKGIDGNNKDLFPGGADKLTRSIFMFSNMVRCFVMGKILTVRFS
jgi:hypothetical protein